jgi:urease accessory protein
VATLTTTTTTQTPVCIAMHSESLSLAPGALLRLQSWLSPAFPTGSYSYSHGLEQAVEVGYVHDLGSLLEWLEADVRYGSVRNEGIFFREAWNSARNCERAKLLEVAEVAAAYRATAEFALESSQQAASSLSLLRRVWPDPLLDWLAETLCEREIQPALAVVIGARSARQGIPLKFALPAFLHSYVGNLVTAAVRLIPLGQTAAQLAVAKLEPEVLTASAQAEESTLADLGSAAFVLDQVSMAHETQYTRLFRS